jgi:hypothetical protein
MPIPKIYVGSLVLEDACIVRSNGLGWEQAVSIYSKYGKLGHFRHVKHYMYVSQASAKLSNEVLVFHKKKNTRHQCPTL